MTSTTLREMLVKQEPRSVSCCYVCSGPRAEYVIYSKPYGDNPFFPFLEVHQPPEGSESMRSDGRVLVCLVCYSFLNQQWDTYEKTKTPYNKRLYWLKRLDGGPFAGMDLNLQQDYESLFESSNAAIDTDSRSKPKQSKSHHSSDLDVIKTKHNAPSYSNAFNFSSQSSEKPDSVGSNILDLSMSTRTPSRSSSTASPGVISEVCYSCGQDAKALTSVFVKFIRNCPTFPSLATHPKPPRAKPVDSDGRINVCNQCHLSLLQQWDYFQRRNTPQHERVYKIPSTELDIPKQEVQPKDKSFACYTCGMVSQTSVQRFISAYPEGDGEPYYSFLLNSMPHPGANKLSNGKAAVCSLCYKSFFRQFQVYEVSKTPEEQRKYKTLNNESVCDNTSVLRQHLEGNAPEPVVESRRECYLCESVTESLFHVNSLPTGDMYFPFIKSLPKPSAAFPMDNHGRVKVCSQCHTSLSYQWNAFEHAFIPINQRQYKIPGSKLQIAGNHGMATSLHPVVSHPSHSKSINVDEDQKLSIKKASVNVCSLCESSLSLENACFLETVPRENCMYFPSIRSFVKCFADQYGRILACNQCFSSLKNQWDVFESARVPHSQRHYEIFPPKSERDRTVHFTSDGVVSEASGALHIQVSSPDLKVDLAKHSSNVEPLLTTVNTLPISSITISTSTMSNSANSPQITDLKGVSMKSSVDEPIPRITGPLDVPFVRPLVLSVPICCFVCGEMNTSSLAYPIRTLPTNDMRMEKTPDDVPFFPFLSKHPVPDGAEKLTSDGSALVCMFCYHSLVSQWLAYEMSNNPEDENRWHRRYNTHNYVCFICGITTYRKRVCSIAVKDFPFLLEHKRPLGALTVLNGECVLTCQTCFESITSQWKDFERMKVPVEMRKYNWIVLPPPPNDENSRGCQILQENSGSTLQPSENDLHIDESSIPHGLKPSSSHLSVPAPYGVSKSAVRNVMSPVHQSGSHAAAGFSPFTNSINPALNATRTSSFAAALRKLAKQAIDPIAEKDLSPISPASTPSSSQQSIHNRQHPQMPMYMNSHNPNPPGHGSPSPSVTPSQSSHGKALDLGRYSNTHRNGSIVEPVSLKMENSKLISSSNDKRSDMPIGNKHLGPPNLPPSLRQDHSLSRGFQPYRNSEERRPTPPQGYNPSPPPSSSMSGYAYHPSILQSSRMPPQSYSRLEESMYMERYGLLRPSSMPYPPPTNMIPHPRAPIYPSNQYPPELISQSMRPVSSNSSSYSTSRYNTEEEDSKDSSMLRRREIIYQHERYTEREEGESREREIEYMRKERNLMRQSPLNTHHSSSRLESSNEEKGHMGSIIHGTPREYGRSMSPPTSTSTTPLNLATSIAHMENHLPPKDEYSSRMSRPPSNTINGQMHLRSTNHIRDMNYRKESDSTSSYRMHYQMNMENEKKPPIHMENLEPSTSIPVSSHSKAHPYFIERDNLKPNVVETRTLSLGSVIDSQINGIFARDNIVCNNNSYFSLNTESNQWENPIKLESENKKPFSAQEPYSIPSKVSSSEKSHESLTSDSSSGKMPPYMLSEHPYLYQGDSNGYPPTFKAKEPLLTRVLKNHDVTSYESEVHSFSEPVERIVSILDAREARLRKLRKDGVIEESDESGIESDEEDSDKLRELLTIRKGPPVKIEADPKKSEFLFYFGLVTDSKRQALELKKRIRRHKALREKSLSPVEDSSVKKEEPIEYDSAHLAELSSRLCYSEDFQAKTEFLRAIDLKYLPPDEKEEREEIIKIAEDERLRRYGLLPPTERCIELQGSHIRKRGCNILDDVKHDAAKKPNVNQNDSLSRFAVPERVGVHKTEPSLKDAKCTIASVQRLSSFLKPPMRTVPLPVPPLIPTCQVVPHASEAAQNKNPSIVAAKDPRVRQVNKDFVQEFHNSVLQTTQMQLAEKKNIPPIVPLESSFQKSPVSAVSEKSDWFYLEYKPPFRWPGIEAIMESYECHISEQNVERKFLTESCQKLKALNEKSNIEVECLQKKTEELLKEKNLLEYKRQELQGSFEKLKLIIQHFR